MSQFISYACPRCAFRVTPGWTAPDLAPRIFCGSCDASLWVAAHDARAPGPPEGLILWQAPSVPPPRRKKHRLRPPPPSVDTGVRVPLREQEGGRWSVALQGCACPQCGGRLHTVSEAAACCPRCGQGAMALEDEPG